MLGDDKELLDEDDEQELVADGRDGGPELIAEEEDEEHDTGESVLGVISERDLILVDVNSEGGGCFHLG